jgi:glycosyltransferase involved in cell wall biosynthesis
MIEVSVVIATRERPEMLRRCLKALAEQRFDRSRFEVMVCDDGPDAATRAVVASFQASARVPFHYVALPCSGGPARARNQGWRLAGGRSGLAAVGAGRHERPAGCRPDGQDHRAATREADGL